MDDVGAFSGQVVVVTEKLDGECTSIYADAYFHARSCTSNFHSSSQWPIREVATSIAPLLPAGFRVVGENLYATHSIPYKGLPAWFFIFAIFDQANRCVSWDETRQRAESWMEAGVRIGVAPEIYHGPFDAQAIRASFTGVSRFGGRQEGYVLRSAAAFSHEMWGDWCGKYVRQGHLATDAEWRRRKIVPNELAEE